jgi:competence protein ComEC
MLMTVSGEPQNNNVLKSYLTANFSALTATEQIKILHFFNEERILILDSTGTYSKTFILPLFYLRNPLK